MSSPLDMVAMLGLKPSSEQHEWLTQLAACPSHFDLRHDDAELASRTAGMFALWRILGTRRSQGIILAPSPKHAEEFMRFLSAVTKECSPQLASVTGFPHWNVVQFGGTSAWALRIISNKPEIVRLRAPSALVGIILHASARNEDFEGACEELERTLTLPGSTLVRVW